MRARRIFLSTAVRAILGLPLFTGGCARGAGSTTAGDDASRWSALIAFLEAEIPALLERGRTTPGAAMALIADAKLLWARGFGVTERATNQPVEANTVFEFGSVSKTVFAYAVLKACERGVLDLDTPLTRYGARRPVDDPRVNMITARHVLSHTAGFPNWRSKDDPMRVKFMPGQGWEYSGEAYNYLQSVLTHVAGRVDESDCRTYEDDFRVCATDFDAYMKANLLVPFGMASSGYVYRDGMARPHNSKGEILADRKSTAVDAARYGSAGQLHSTVIDYAKFLIEVIDPRPADEYRLSPAVGR